MPQFIRSADMEFIINVSNVQRIYEVINPKAFNFRSIFFGSGQESGIYSEILGKDSSLRSYPLVTLSDAKYLVGLFYSPTSTEQYIKALSCWHSQFVLFRSMLDQVEYGLFNNMKIIDMYSLLEKAINWHVRYITDIEESYDQAENISQEEADACC